MMAQLTFVTESQNKLLDKLGCQRQDFNWALHSAAHALLAMAPTIAQCNAQELECEHSYGTTQRILIYETRTDTGLTEALFMQMFVLFAFSSSSFNFALQ